MPFFQPKGAGTTKKEGTVLVQAPKGIGTGWYADDRYRIDTYVSNLPTTGEMIATYTGRFDDIAYYRT